MMSNKHYYKVRVYTNRLCDLPAVGKSTPPEPYASVHGWRSLWMCRVHFEWAEQRFSKTKY